MREVRMSRTELEQGRTERMGLECPQDEPQKRDQAERSACHVTTPVPVRDRIVESHWRRIKHDFLHRFNRSRVDLVVWLLTRRGIPDAMRRMDDLLDGGNRTAMESWRKDYKQEWKKLAGLELNPEAIRRYHTNPQWWVCGCPAFLESRFLPCKHLVHCLEPIADRVKFFSRVRRQTTSPFWTHPQPVLKPEFAPRHPPVEAAVKVRCTNLGALT